MILAGMQIQTLSALEQYGVLLAVATFLIVFGGGAWKALNKFLTWQEAQAKLLRDWQETQSQAREHAQNEREKLWREYMDNRDETVCGQMADVTKALKELTSKIQDHDAYARNRRPGL